MTPDKIFRACGVLLLAASVGGCALVTVVDAGALNTVFIDRDEDLFVGSGDRLPSIANVNDYARRIRKCEVLHRGRAVHFNRGDECAVVFAYAEAADIRDGCGLERKSDKRQAQPRAQCLGEGIVW